MKRLIHTAVLAAALAFALLLCGCSGAETGHKAPQRAAVESGERQFAQPSDGDFIAIFSTSLGEVRAVLYPDAAPMAVQNFVGLARSGYYDNTVIWRAQYGFAVQGGDAGGTGSGGATIWSNNPYPLEADSSLRHYAGALCAAFAQGGEVTGGNSQFYFVTALPNSVDETMQQQLRDNGYSDEQVSAYAAAGGRRKRPQGRAHDGRAFVAGIGTCHQRTPQAARAVDGLLSIDRGIGVSFPLVTFVWISKRK